MLGIGNIVFYAGIIYLSKLLFNLLWDFKNAFSAYIFPRICSVDYKEKYGEWAVVTGCTQGIGKCYAEELAQKGLNIVLILCSFKPCTGDVFVFISAFVPEYECYYCSVSSLLEVIA